MDLITLITLLVIGLFAGFASGMVGIGGGVVIVPALVYFLHLSQHEAQGVSIGMLLMPVGFLAAYNYYKSGNFHFSYSVLIGVTFVLGAFLGSKVSLRIDEVLMKRIFGIVMLLLSIKMIFSK
ncbi:MAG: sulfite exporter TauE/SafE family protein [Bacteroidetes bacterium]|nr:sulfite exporter TauE/SafE family protein [Bacteroidota bacterium]